MFTIGRLYRSPQGRRWRRREEWDNHGVRMWGCRSKFNHGANQRKEQDKGEGVLVYRIAMVEELPESWVEVRLDRSKNQAVIWSYHIAQYYHGYVLVKVRYSSRPLLITLCRSFAFMQCFLAPSRPSMLHSHSSGFRTQHRFSNTAWGGCTKIRAECIRTWPYNYP